MADYQQEVSYGNEPVNVARPNWGAIWAGMFSFIAIWAVFGALGMGVFASAANPHSATSSMDVGMGVWSVILTIVAMFVAGRTTGQLVGATNSRMLHSTVMFGLTVTASLLIAVIGGNAFASAEVTANGHSAYLLGAFSGLGWTLFVSLFLGWLAAIGGAATAHRDLPHGSLAHQVSHA